MIGADHVREAFSAEQYLIDYLRIYSIFGDKSFEDDIKIEQILTGNNVRLIFRDNKLTEINLYNNGIQGYAFMLNDFWGEIVHETYEELYRQSTPSVDFSELIYGAEINAFGEREIPYENYEICKNQFDKILKNKIKKFNLSGVNKNKFINTITLGCSPKFKTYEEV